MSKSSGVISAFLHMACLYFAISAFEKSGTENSKFWFIRILLEELSDIIKHADLISETHSKGAKATIQLGSAIMVSINGKKEEFSLVGEWEADPKNKKISHESPLGKALMGKVIGEKVEVEAPAGKVVYTVVGIN